VDGDLHLHILIGASQLRSDRSSPPFLYVQIQREILAKIQGGEWSASFKLLTIRQAFEGLTSQGWINRMPGQDTFGSRPTVTPSLAYGFLSFMKGLALRSGPAPEVNENMIHENNPGKHTCSVSFTANERATNQMKKSGCNVRSQRG